MVATIDCIVTSVRYPSDLDLLIGGLKNAIYFLVGHSGKHEKSTN